MDRSKIAHNLHSGRWQTASIIMAIRIEHKGAVVVSGDNARECRAVHVRRASADGGGIELRLQRRDPARQRRHEAAPSARHQCRSRRTVCRQRHSRRLHTYAGLLCGNFHAALCADHRHDRIIEGLRFRIVGNGYAHMIDHRLFLPETPVAISGEHEVHVLHGSTGGALAEIVEKRTRLTCGCPASRKRRAS